MRLFRWFILRALSRDPVRTVLTVAGVAVGVAVVLAIRLANTSSIHGFETALDAISGRTSLEVVAPGVGVADELVAELGWLRQLGRVSPIIDGDAVIRPRTGARGEVVRVLGVDILRERPFRDYQVRDPGQDDGGEDAAAGDPNVATDDRDIDRRGITTQEFLSILTDERAVVLTRAFARRHDLEIGGLVELVTGDRVVPLVVRGLLEAGGPAQIREGNFALMDIAAAQLTLGRLGEIDRLDIRLREDIAVDAAAATIAERLPAGLMVQRPERRGAQVEKMLAAFQFNLEALSYISLIVGLFLVYNTISVSVITRRPEIGMLRTIGASRGNVLGLFLGEAVSLALVASACGAPLGWLLARGAVGFTSSTVSTFWVASAATVPDLGAGDVGLAFAIGVPLAIVAAIAPALEAARLAPVSAVRSEQDLAVRAVLPRRYLAGAVSLFVLGAGFAGLRPVGGLPVFGLAAAVVVVLGAALLVPVALHQAQRARPWVDRWLGIEGVIARSNVGASIRRLAISVAALSVSLAMMVAIAIMIGSFRETVVYWVGQTLQADLFVSSARSGPVGNRGAVSPEVERLVRDQPGVVAVDGFRSIDVPYGDSLIIVGSGRFPVLLEHGNLLFKAPSDGRAALAAAIDRRPPAGLGGRLVGVTGGSRDDSDVDTVLVSESFSLRFDKNVGDRIELPTPHGERRFRIGAVYYDYSSDRGQVVMDEPVFDRRYDNRRPAGLTVYLDDGVDPNVAHDEVRRRLGDRPLFVTTNATLRQQVLTIFDSTFAITYALEGIAIVVSMFGVAATLLTLALERRREMTVLRLVGAEGRHLRRVIMIEAGMIGAVSLVVGLVVGLMLSLILIFVINVQSFGWTIQFHLPFAFLVQASGFVLLASAVAGLYPARLAARWTMADLSGENT